MILCFSLLSENTACFELGYRAYVYIWCYEFFLGLDFRRAVYIRGGNLVGEFSDVKKSG